MEEVRFTLLALICLSACTTAPEPDPLAYATPQTQIVYPGADGDVMWIDPEITAICRDGWVSYSQHQRGTCSHHHGIRTRVNWPAD